MAGAFQSDAFQSDAFQSEDVEGLIKFHGISSTLEIGTVIVDDRTLKPIGLSSTISFGNILVRDYLLGSGTSNDPYQIWDLSDLKRIGIGIYTLDKYYKLMDNIDASPTADPAYNGGAGWLPIGNSTTQFTGYFDGNSKTISGLYINRPTTDNVGFFGYVNRGGEVIKNLSVTGIVTGQSNVGLLIGYCYAGTINSCNCNGTVTGTGNQIGGIIGQVRTVTINSSTMQGTVQGSSTSDNVGGIVGYNSNASCIISSCTNQANVSGRNNIGGIQGYAYCDYYFTSCTVTADVTGSYAIGGLIGGTRSAGCVSRIITSNYEGTVTGVNYVGGIGGQCLILGANTYTDNCTIKGTIIGTGSQIGGAYGQFRSEIRNTNIISGELTINTTNLDYVGGLVGYVQDYCNINNCDVNIDIAGRDYIGGLIGASRESNNNCIIINSSYEGELDGRNYIGGLIGYNGHYGTTTLFSYSTIKGMITATGNYIGGVAGYMRGYVEHIDITDELTFNCPNSNQVGGIVGTSGPSYCSVRYCTVSLNITALGKLGGIIGNLPNGNADFQVYNNSYTGTLSGTTYVGGIVGFCEFYGVDSRINNCDVSGIINASGNYVGGILGYGKAKWLYNNSVTSLTISASNSSYVGGVVGYIATGLTVYGNKILATITALDYVGGIIGNSNATDFITNCYLNLFYGNITGRDYIGGIAGYLRNTNTGTTCIISKCYSIGTIVATGSYIGGVGGHIRPAISNCFSQMAVSGNTNIGGLVGYKTTNNITNCYSKGLVVGNSSIGGLVGVTSVATATNSYWDTQTSNQASSALGTGMTTDQLTYPYDASAYSGWDFATPIWTDIGTNQYPWLKELPRFFLVNGIDSTLGIGILEVVQGIKLLPSSIENINYLGSLKLNLRLLSEGINSNIIIGNLQLNLRLLLEDLESRLEFGDLHLGLLLKLSSIDSSNLFGLIELYLRNNIIIRSLDSSNEFGLLQLNLRLLLDAIESGLNIGSFRPAFAPNFEGEGIGATDEYGLLQLNLKLYLDSLESRFSTGVCKLNLKLFLNSLENNSYLGSFRPAFAPNFEGEGIGATDEYGLLQLNLRLLLISLENISEIPLPLFILFLKPNGFSLINEFGLFGIGLLLGLASIDSRLLFGDIKLSLKLRMISLLSEEEIGLMWIYLWYNNQYANFKLNSPVTSIELLNPDIVIQIKKPVTNFNLVKPITEFNLLEPQTIFNIKG